MSQTAAENKGTGPVTPQGVTAPVINKALETVESNVTESLLSQENTGIALPTPTIPIPTPIPVPQVQVTTEIPKVELPKYLGKVFGGRIGSRKVLIIRLDGKFGLLPNKKEAKSLHDDVVIKLGCQWKKGTRDVIRGLSREEEKVFLPKHIGLNGPQAEKWEEKVMAHWLDFFVQVPNNDDGVELEVGFKKDEESGEIVPINLKDYMSYGWCKEHSWVIKEGEDNILPDNKVRIVDRTKLQNTLEKQFEIKKEIDRLFNKIVSSKEEKDRHTIDWILETNGGEDGRGLFIDNLSDIQKEMELEKFKDKNPNLFKEILEDKKLELKALIRKAVGLRVSLLSLEGGNTYFYDNQAIGDIDDVVGYLSNPNNIKQRQMVEQLVKDAK